MSADLISRRVRIEFREYSSAWGTLRLITDAFDAEDFVPGPESEEGTARRALFNTYADAIDWQDYGQVARALRVFEEILSWVGGMTAESSDKAFKKLRRLLDYDGYVLDNGGRIRNSTHRRLAQLPLEHLRDAASIDEHLRRLDPSDPPLAISAAKSLIEATCKHVLEALDTSYEEKSDIPVLVKSVQKALKAHPDTVAPTAKGRDTIIRVLSNLSQVAIGIAELRNEYGTDHGRTRPSGGLGQRHAHLAAGVAHTYCCFLLETLADRQRSIEHDPRTTHSARPPPQLRPDPAPTTHRWIEARESPNA